MSAHVLLSFHLWPLCGGTGCCFALASVCCCCVLCYSVLSHASFTAAPVVYVRRPPSFCMRFTCALTAPRELVVLLPPPSHLLLSRVPPWALSTCLVPLLCWQLFVAGFSERPSSRSGFSAVRPLLILQRTFRHLVEGLERRSLAPSTPQLSVRYTSVFAPFLA